MFCVTVFDITVRNMEDLHLVVEARVGGCYGSSGTVEVGFPNLI